MMTTLLVTNNRMSIENYYLKFCLLACDPTIDLSFIIG